MNRLRMWLRAALARRSADRELTREMESHIAMERDNLIRQGVPASEADRRARVAFGGVHRFTEDVRDQRDTRWLDALWQDVRYAFRQYARAPWIALTVVVTLALGLGASSWMFIAAEYFAPRTPTGVSADRELVRVRGTVVSDRGPGNRWLSYQELDALRARSEIFASVAGASDIRAVTMPGTAEGAWEIGIQFVTSGFLGILGVQPQYGSVLAADDDTPGVPAVFISARLWRRAFASRTDIVGTTVRIGKTTATVVGVAPSGFKALQGMNDGSADAWMPLSAFDAVAGPGRKGIGRTDQVFHVVAALRPGTGVKRATTAAQSAGAAAAALYTRNKVTTSSDVVSLLNSNARAYDTNHDAAILISILGGIALLVLAIVGTNVSALMLGRSAGRRREIGVRISLGATRTRLVRQLLTESVMLAAAAGALGLAVLVVILRFVNREIPDDTVYIGWWTLAGTALVSLGTGIVCGLSPALHATRASIADVLKGSVTGTPKQTRAQRRLITAQIALSQPLLIGLVVMTLSIYKNERSRFDADATRQVLVFGLSPAELSPLRSDSTIGLTVGNRAVATLTEAVGVERAALGARWTTGGSFHIAPDGEVRDQTFQGSLTPAGPNYFSVMGATIVRGREFSAADVPGAANALIVGSDFARQYYGDADPVGRRVACERGCPATEYAIVGVIDTVALGSTMRDTRARMYFAAAQASSFVDPTVYVRVRGDAAALVPVLRARLVEQFPNTPIGTAATFASMNGAQQRENLQMGAGAAGAGVLTLLLAAVGLYGVVSFAVNQRTREIGVRIALGATSSGVIRHFFRDGLRLSVIGCAIGLPASLIAIRAIFPARELRGVNTVLVSVAVTLVVISIAMLATWLPARRAARVDPLTALRSD